MSAPQFSFAAASCWPLAPTATPEGERQRVAYNDQRQLLFVYANGSVGPSHPLYASLHWAYSVQQQPLPPAKMGYVYHCRNFNNTVSTGVLDPYSAMQLQMQTEQQQQRLDALAQLEMMRRQQDTAQAYQLEFQKQQEMMRQQLMIQTVIENVLPAAPAQQPQHQQQMMTMQRLQQLEAMRQRQQNVQAKFSATAQQQQKMSKKKQQAQSTRGWGVGAAAPQYQQQPTALSNEQAQEQMMRQQQQHQRYQQAIMDSYYRRQNEAAKAVRVSTMTREQEVPITNQEQEPLIERKVAEQVQSQATDQEHLAQHAIAAADLAASSTAVAEQSPVIPIVVEAVKEAATPIIAQEPMDSRVNFKLTRDGETYRFASTLPDNELFRAVIAKVGSIVKNGDLDVFWNDGESNIVLETSEDLAAAIDFAKHTRKNPSKPPCVRLFVDEIREIEVESVAEVREEVTAVPELVEKIASVSIATPKPKMELGYTENALLEIMLDFEENGVVMSPFIINELANPSNIIPSGSPLDLEIRWLVVQTVTEFSRKEENVLEYLKKLSRKDLAMAVICQWIKHEMENEEYLVEVSPLTIAALQVIAATGEQNSAFLRLLMHNARFSYSDVRLIEKADPTKNEEVNIEGDLRRYVNLEAYCIMCTGLKHFVSKETKDRLQTESEAGKVAVAEWITERSKFCARFEKMEDQIKFLKIVQAEIRQKIVRGDQTDFDAVGAAKVAAAALQAATPSAEAIEMTTEELQQCADSDMETAWEMSDEEEDEDSEEEDEKESSESESASDDDEIEFVKNTRTEEDEETEEEDEDKKERKEEEEDSVFATGIRATLKAMANKFKKVAVTAEGPVESSPIEYVQPIQSTSETKEEKVDSAEVVKELKIKQKMAELKNVSFWDVMASFEVKMEEIEDKMDDLEERIDDIEEVNGEETIETRMVEMEERMEKVEKRIDESKDVVL